MYSSPLSSHWLVLCSPPNKGGPQRLPDGPWYVPLVLVDAVDLNRTSEGDIEYHLYPEELATSYHSCSKPEYIEFYKESYDYYVRHQVPITYSVFRRLCKKTGINEIYLSKAYVL